jgi:siroheme synthase
MAAKTVVELSELLLRYTRTPDTALAVIEQATTIHQQVHLTTLQKCAMDFAGKSFSSPSLVIVGDVVELHNQFQWLESSDEGSIFKDLSE